MNRLQIIIFLMFSLLGIPSQAQTPQTLNWQAGPSLNSPRSQGVALLAADKSILYIGGNSVVNSQTVARLMPGASAWTTASNIDTPRISPGVVSSGLDRIFIYGGTGGGEASNEVLDYDFRNGDSQDIAKMTVARRQFSFAVDSFGMPYAVGGKDNKGNVLFDTEYYDPASDTWTQMIDLPDARYDSSAVGDNNGNIFVFGGADSTGAIVDSVFCFSTTENSWVTLTPLPIAVENSAAVYTEGHIYVIGGMAESGTIAKIQVYDIATGTWRMDTDLPEARANHTAIIDDSGQLLVIGGNDNNGIATSTVFQSQRLYLPDSIPVITSSAVVNASLDQPYRYDVNANANPAPAYSLIHAPAGMSIDSSTGLINWQPVDGQVGDHNITVRASNRAGQDEQNFIITVVADTIAPISPTNLTFNSVTETTVNLIWTAASDKNGIDHYALFKTRRCGWRGSRTCYVPLLGQQNIPSNLTTVTGLTPLSYTSFVVRAIDPSGNISGVSNKVTVQTLSKPVNFGYFFKGKRAMAVSAPANSLLALNLFSSANPTASYSLVSGPQGITVNPTSGLVQWTPSANNVGRYNLVFQAKNSLGFSTLTVPITVLSDAPQLSVQFNPANGGVRYAVAGVAFTAQIKDNSSTTPTYALINPPAGMSINQNSGLISWLPAANQAGLTSVTVRATNPGGSSDLIVKFYTHFSGPVSTIQVSNQTALQPLVKWTAPTGTGANLVQGYTVVASAKYRWGSRSTRTDRVAYNVPVSQTQLELTGLTAGRNYKLSINAYDAAGNRGLVNPDIISVIPNPALPNLSWKVSNAAGGHYVIAGQPMRIELTDSRSATDPSRFSVVNAPADLSIDPVSGIARWTPSPTDVGSVVITLRATNSVGPKDIAITVPVYFSGPVINASASRIGNTSAASAKWFSPADNVFPVAGYQVTLHWRWGSRNRSRSFTTSANQVNFSLIPTGAVWHKGITISAFDAQGRQGVPTPLIPYGTVAPPPPQNLPPVANAGLNQTIVLPHTAVTLNGKVTDDGLPSIPGQLQSTWTVVSGPGPVTFANRNSASTTASFINAGVYTLRLQVSDGELSHQNEVIITVNPAPQPINHAPVAHTGSAQTITLPNNRVNLSGWATDDGLPANPGTLDYSWQSISGSAAVSFSNQNAASTSAQFTSAGVYTLQLTVTDGALSHSANVTITVNPAPISQGPTIPAFDANAAPIERQGNLQQMGNNFIIVGDTKIWYTANTVIKFEDGTGGVFKMGQTIQLKGSQNTDGSATASKIQVGG